MHFLFSLPMFNVCKVCLNIRIFLYNSIFLIFCILYQILYRDGFGVVVLVKTGFRHRHVENCFSAYFLHEVIETCDSVLQNGYHLIKKQ